MAAGCEPLVLFGDRSSAKTTRLGNLDSFCFIEGEKVQEGRRDDLYTPSKHETYFLILKGTSKNHKTA